MKKIIFYFMTVLIFVSITFAQKLKFGYGLMDGDKGGLIWTLNYKPNQLNPGLYTLIPDNFTFEFGISEKNTIVVGAGVFRDYLLIGAPGIRLGFRRDINWMEFSNYSLQFHQTLDRSQSRLDGVHAMVNMELEGNGVGLFRDKLFMIPKIDIGLKLYDRNLESDSFRVKDYLRFPVELYLGKYKNIGLDFGTVVFHTTNDPKLPLILFPDLYFGFIYNF